MPLIKQGGSDPYSGQDFTTTGYKAHRPPVCMKCGERKKGLYSINVNGQLVCADCMGRAGEGVLSSEVSDGEGPSAD